jgi:hypothetical protein
MKIKELVRTIIIIVVGLGFLIVMTMALVDSTEIGTREVIKKTEQVNVATYRTEIVQLQEDLDSQISGLITLLEMAKGQPSLHIYATWTNELNNRLNSIGMDFYKIGKLVPPEADQARHEKLAAVGSEFNNAKQLILGGIHTNDQEMVDQGKAVILEIAKIIKLGVE